MGASGSVRAAKWAGVGGIGVGVVFAVALVGLWSARKPIGARLVVDYLGRRGVRASFHIARLDAGGLSGSLVVGRPDDPDLTVERLDLAFAPPQLSLHGVTAPRITRIRLRRPNLKARFDGRRLSFGALQPLIEGSGGGGAGASPAITIEDGRLRLDNPAGRLVLAGDGALAPGRIAWASARIVSGAFGVAGVRLEGLRGGLRLVSPGSADRLHAAWRLEADAVQAGAARARGVELQGDAEASTHVAGPVRLDARLRLRDLVRADAVARGVDARLSLSGDARGSPQASAFAGAGSVAITAAAAGAGAATTADATIVLRSSALRFTYAAPTLRLDAPFDLDLGARSARVDAQGSPMALSALAVRGGGRARLVDGRPRVAFTGAARGRGALATRDARRLAATIAPPVAGEALRRTVAASLADFSVAATRFAAVVDKDRVDLSLVAPLRVAAEAGVAASVSGVSKAPLLRLSSGVASGGFVLRLAGPGLPAAEATVAHYRLGADAGGSTVDAEGSVQASGDLGPLRGLAVRARAVLARHAGRLGVVAPECTDLGLDGYTPANVGDVRLQLCPTSVPLLALDGRRWRVAATLKPFAARITGADVDVDADEGRIDLQGEGATPSAGAIAFAGVRLRDAATIARFHPLFAQGVATLGATTSGAAGWRGDADFALAPSAKAVAHARLRHDPRTGVGAATFETTGLRFTREGLQPAQLVAAAQPWMSQVEGAIDLSAAASWRGATVASQARVATPGLDLRSPAGLLTGVRGEVRFVSLSPLITAPRQSVRVDALTTLLPLTDLALTFDLDGARLNLRDAGATLAGGRARLDPMTIPLTAPSGAVPPVAGALRLEAVDANTLIGVLNLSNSVSLQARVSGVLPFAVGSQGVRLAQGRLAAVGPGRLTIRRQALTQAMATGGAAGAQPGAVQDFAYQALEDLAFDSLDAAVDSRPQGRLGVILHVKGRHDPPTSTVTRVRLGDLLAGRAFDKPLPLPKGTAIDLTLDTSLNFDELLADYGSLRFGSGSAEVHPDAP